MYIAAAGQPMLYSSFKPIEYSISVKQWCCLSLDAWLDEPLFEGSVDPSAHSHIGSVADGGDTLDTLQAGGAAQACVATSTCRQPTEEHSC